MKRRLSRRDTSFLYLLIVGWSLCVFLLGISVGSSSLAPIRPSIEESKDTPRVGLRNEESRAADPFPEKAVPADAASDITDPGVPPEKTFAESESTPVPEEAAPAPDAFYAVQVAAFRTREETVDVLLKLEHKGYTGRVVPPDDGNRFYRVWVGETDSRPEARLLRERLKLDGFPTFLKRVANPH